MKLSKVLRLNKFKIRPKFFKPISLGGVLGIVVLVLLLYNFALSLKRVLNIFSNTFSQRDLSKEEKIAQSWKPVYSVADLLNKYLDEDSSVIHPPQNRNQWLGNRAVIRYFLYPKKLYAENPALFDEKRIDAVIITNSWPDFFVPIKEVYHEPIRSYIDVARLTIDSRGAVYNNLIDINKGISLNRRDGAESTEIISHSMSFREGVAAEQIDFVIQESGVDMWLVEIDRVLTPDMVVEGELESGAGQMGSLMAEVEYESGQRAVFSSERNKYKNQHELLSIRDIYERAVEYGNYSGLGGPVKLTGVGISFGTSVKGPYHSKGIGLIDNGDRILESVINSPEKHYLKALSYYRRGEFALANEQLSLARLLLEDTSTFLLSGLVLECQGNYSSARNFFESAVLEGDLWSGVELAKLVDSENYPFYKGVLEEAYANHFENTHLNLELARLFERLDMKTLAFKHFMKASRDYPRTATSVEAAYALDGYRKGEIGESELDLSMRAYLDGEFTKSAKLLADLYNKNPNDVKLREQFDKAFIVRSKTFDDEDIFFEEKPSGYIGNGSYLTDDVAFSLGSYYFPPEIERGSKEGTLIFYWQVLAANRLDNPDLRYYLIDQVGSLGRLQPTLGLFVKDRVLHLEFRDSDALFPKVKYIKSAPINWREGQWYKIVISWGNGLINLYIDDKLVGQITARERVGKKDLKIYFGLAADKAEESPYNPDRFKAMGIIDEIELYSYTKKFEKGVEVWE